jgi:hypothetical protein
MVDPLALSQGIITVLQLTVTVINYLKDAKHASADRKTILDEVECIRSLLSILNEKATSPESKEKWHETLKSLNGPNGPLEQCKLLLEGLVSKLRPADGLKKVGIALFWPFQKQDIKDILSNMERQKTLFLLALQNDHR